MTTLIFGVYAAICVVVTVAFIALGLASRRMAKSDVLESMKEFDQSVCDRRSNSESKKGDVSNDADQLSASLSRTPKLTR
jgi:hypothetical protein